MHLRYVWHCISDSSRVSKGARLKIIDTFQNGSEAKGKFLSRVFGIFSEEIVRIWAMDKRSPYSVAERRPTIYDGSKPYVLDFLFLRDGKSYVAEMKCEIQYQNYKYWTLTDATQLDHHRNKRAFQLFLEVAENPSSVSVKAGDEVTPDGAVLVWGSVTTAGVDSVRQRYGLTDVISVEKCIGDLVEWRNEEYQKLVSDRSDWTSDLFQSLREANQL